MKHCVWNKVSIRVRIHRFLCKKSKRGRKNTIKVPLNLVKRFIDIYYCCFLLRKTKNSTSKSSLCLGICMILRIVLSKLWRRRMKYIALITKEWTRFSTAVHLIILKIIWLSLRNLMILNWDTILRGRLNNRLKIVMKDLVVNIDFYIISIKIFFYQKYSLLLKIWILFMDIYIDFD